MDVAEARHGHDQRLALLEGDPPDVGLGGVRIDLEHLRAPPEPVAGELLVASFAPAKFGILPAPGKRETPARSSPSRRRGGPGPSFSSGPGLGRRHGVRHPKVRLASGPNQPQMRRETILRQVTADAVGRILWQGKAVGEAAVECEAEYISEACDRPGGPRRHGTAAGRRRLADDDAQKDQIAPGVKIGGVDVGGRAVDSARKIIKREVVKPLQQPVVVMYDGKRSTLSADQLDPIGRRRQG